MKIVLNCVRALALDVFLLRYDADRLKPITLHLTWRSGACCYHRLQVTLQALSLVKHRQDSRAFQNSISVFTVGLILNVSLKRYQLCNNVFGPGQEGA